MAIEFFCEDVEKPRVKYVALRKWIKDVVELRGKTVGKINYIFCSDEYLLDINMQYLNHDYYTDVITFDNCEDNIVSGDIYISVERVAENAKAYHTEGTEIFRVIIHAILHLLGLNDKSEEEEKAMRAAEDECLAMSCFDFCRWMKDSKM